MKKQYLVKIKIYGSYPKYFSISLIDQYFEMFFKVIKFKTFASEKRLFSLKNNSLERINCFC